MNLKQSLDKFILHFPTLFIKQYPYAWIVAIVLWTWPLNVSVIFLLIVIVGILSLRWRSAAWISEMRRLHAPTGETFYIDRPPIPWKRAVRNLTILIAISGATAWFLNEQLGLTFWRAFIMCAGFGLFYFDTRFIGATTTYIVTGGGIAIYYIPGHIDYRIFIRFNELDEIIKQSHIEEIPESWSVLSRLRAVKNGVLLVSRYAKGFSRMLGKEVLLTPTKVDEFIQFVPSTLVRDKLSSAASPGRAMNTHREDAPREAG